MMKTVSVEKILKTDDYLEKEIRVVGFVRSRRDSKGFSFIDLNDGTTVGNLQIIAFDNIPDYQDKVLSITTGSSIAVEGKVRLSEGKGQKYEVVADRIYIYGIAPKNYPLQKKHHSLEFLREIAHLRPRTNTIGAVMRMRSGLSFAIHSFFRERGFYYVHTPIITTSDCEGAGEMFTVTTLDLNNIPKDETTGKVDFSKDFFGKEAHLTVSGQLEGEICALALSKIYTFGPTFRAENSNTPRHLAEFWMIEPEMAFWNLYDTIQLGEDLIRYVVQDILEFCEKDLEV
ncbi:MAG: OB-fold nucleic acid binding domain-containing protein, partial [Chitinispirillaceae bacterium]|nr:OB-fold nucleic acid binding domain-containing protein [Chitinispirillaceae bacterium]